MCGEGCYAGCCGRVEEVSLFICEVVSCYHGVEKMCVY